MTQVVLLCTLCFTAPLVSARRGKLKRKLAAIEKRLDEEVGARLDELARELQELNGCKYTLY